MDQWRLAPAFAPSGPRASSRISAFASTSGGGRDDVEPDRVEHG
jgi:hypothetical protein